MSAREDLFSPVAQTDDGSALAGFLPLTRWDALEYIVRSVERNGRPPTIKELSAWVGCSQTTAIHCLRDLERNGWIAVKPTQSRAITVLKVP